MMLRLALKLVTIKTNYSETKRRTIMMLQLAVEPMTILKLKGEQSRCILSNQLFRSLCA